MGMIFAQIIDTFSLTRLVAQKSLRPKISETPVTEQRAPTGSHDIWICI